MRAMLTGAAACSTGTASSTCWSSRLSRSCGRSGRAGLHQRVLAGRRDELEHLLAVGHEQRVTGADQLVHARRRRAGDRTRHPHQRAVEPQRPGRGVERAAADRCLHHDRAAAERRDDPVAAQEPQLGRCAAGRELRDDQPRVGDVVEELPVGARVGAVDAARQHRDRRPTHREGAAVGGLVDAEGRPGHHRVALLGKRRTDLTGHPAAVGRRRARADDRHRPLDRLRQVQRAADPEPQRSAPTAGQRLGTVEVAEPGGPLLVTGDHEPDAPLGRSAQVADRVQRGESLGDVGGQAALVGLAEQPVVDQGRAHVGDEPGEPGIARLTEPAQGRPCHPVGRGAHEPAARARVRSSSGLPERSRSATSSSARPGRSTPRRSETVQASRCTLTAPRWVSRPE